MSGRGGTMYYFFNIAVAILLIISAIACTTDPQTITTEVTREVPVTVETVQTVEVTRQIPVQVPVTVEVNREVQSTKIVEITREVPVTRLVVITPTAAPSPTVSAMATGIPVTVAPTPDPTITPTASPTVAPTKTPMSTSTPAPQKSFGSWQMRAEPEHIGLHDVLYFDNLAQEWGQKTEKPKLVYQCNSRGQRAVYIDWNLPLATQTSYVPRYTDDPLRQYCDDDLGNL